GSNGVLIGASGITIDLKGHTLRGNRAAGMYGVSGGNVFTQGVKIANGVIRNFDSGIRALASDHMTISKLVISGNLNVGIEVDGGGLVVKSSVVSGNGGDGAYVTTNGGKISASTFAGNGGAGISAGGPLAVTSVVTAGNAYDGINIGGPLTKVTKSVAS